MADEKQSDKPKTDEEKLREDVEKIVTEGDVDWNTDED